MHSERGAPRWLAQAFEYAADVILELKIEEARQRFVASTTMESRTVAWQEMAALHRRRSPAQIDEMERGRGLR